MYLTYAKLILDEQLQLLRHIRKRPVLMSAELFGVQPTQKPFCLSSK